METNLQQEILNILETLKEPKSEPNVLMLTSVFTQNYEYEGNNSNKRIRHVD